MNERARPVGTCATYTQTTVDGISTFSTSKGPCSIEPTSNLFTCAEGNTASGFAVDEAGNLGYQQGTAFSADEVPPGSTREPVYVGAGRKVGLGLVFSSKPVETTKMPGATSTAAQSSSVAVSPRS